MFVLLRLRPLKPWTDRQVFRYCAFHLKWMNDKYTTHSFFRPPDQNLIPKPNPSVLIQQTLNDPIHQVFFRNFNMDEQAVGSFFVGNKTV